MLKNKTASLDDVLLVGTGKLVGYKLLNDLKDLCKIDPAVLQAQLEQKNLKTLIVTGDDCAMRGGALYAWDESGLATFLESHKATLEKCSWPTEPEAFIRKLALDWAPPKTQLFDIIADAFGDKDNAGRTDVPPSPTQHRHPAP